MCLEVRSGKFITIRLFRGASPLGLPLHAHSRGPLRSPLRSRGLAHAVRSRPTRGFAPRTPLHAHSRGPCDPRSVHPPRGFAPRTPLHAHSRGPCNPRSVPRGLAHPSQLAPPGFLRLVGPLRSPLRYPPRGFAPRTPLHAHSRGPLARRAFAPSDSLRSVLGAVAQSAKAARVGWLAAFARVANRDALHLSRRPGSIWRSHASKVAMTASAYLDMFRNALREYRLGVSRRINDSCGRRDTGCGGRAAVPVGAAARRGVRVELRQRRPALRRRSAITRRMARGQRTRQATAPES